MRATYRAVALVALLSACGRPVTIDAPFPVAVDSLGTPELPPLLPSMVDAPIALSLGPALEALETAVPRTFGNLERRIRNPNNGRQHFAYEATRSPFTVALEEERITLGTIVHYAGRGWYNPPLLPEVSAACGTDGDQPRLRARVQSSLALSPDWQLRTRTRLLALTPYSDTDRDACRLTSFQIDVTDRVIGGVQGVLRRELPKVDRTLARWNVRDRLTRWYELLNRPIQVTDSMWLLLQPGAVRYGGLELNDTAVIVDVRLFTTPTLVSGTRPVPRPVTLPRFSEAASEVGDSARILLEARLEYSTVSDLLRKGLVGRTFSRWQRRVRIDDVRLVPVGDGRLALGVRFDGALRGEGWLIGTPQLDVATGVLSVPDLDFDVATGDLLVHGLAFLRTDAVLAQLREAAQLPLAGPLDALREKVQGAMNRELADGVSLFAELTSARVIQVAALPTALVARAETTGSIGLGIDRELRVKRGRK
jgi:hypothetical protein